MPKALLLSFPAGPGADSFVFMTNAKAPDSFITLQDVIKHMDSGQRFDITVVKADVKRGTGGGMVTYTGCQKHMAPKKKGTPETAAPPREARNPNHYNNSTRNIMLLRTREIKKIHLRLITRFNGKSVT